VFTQTLLETVPGIISVGPSMGTRPFQSRTRVIPGSEEGSLLRADEVPALRSQSGRAPVNSGQAHEVPVAAEDSRFANTTADDCRTLAFRSTRG